MLVSNSIRWFRTPVWSVNAPTAFVGVEQWDRRNHFFISLPTDFNLLKYKAMEKRIKLTTSTSFNLADDELKRFYTIMSLLQYCHQRTPDYKEVAIVKRLKNDFQRYNIEIIKACDSDPNNLILSQIRNFIEHHYGCLKRITKQLDKE